MVSITVNIDALGFEEDPETGELIPGPTMEEQVVAALVERIMRRSDAIVRQVTTRIDREIDSVVRERVLDVLNAPIQLTSSWNGVPKGDPVAVEDLIQKSVEKYITAPSGDRNTYNRTTNNMGELIDELVKNALNTTLKPAVDEAKKRMTNEIVQRAIAGAVTALTPAVR